LACFNARRRFGQHAHGALLLGNAITVAQRLGSAQEHSPADRFQKRCAVRRRTEAQSFEKKPKFRVGFFGADAHQTENFFLQLDGWISDAAAADLDAVERQVIGLERPLCRLAFSNGKSSSSGAVNG